MPKTWSNKMDYSRSICRLIQEDNKVLRYVTNIAETLPNTDRKVRAEEAPSLNLMEKTNMPIIAAISKSSFSRTFANFDFPSINDKKVDLTKMKQWPSTEVSRNNRKAR